MGTIKYIKKFHFRESKVQANLKKHILHLPEKCQLDSCLLV